MNRLTRRDIASIEGFVPGGEGVVDAVLVGDRYGCTRLHREISRMKSEILDDDMLRRSRCRRA